MLPLMVSTATRFYSKKCRAFSQSLQVEGKGKFVPVLFLLIDHYAMKAYWGSGGMPSHYLTSALDAGEWSASRTGRFTPRERASGTHWIGGWVGPRAVLDAVVERKIPSLSFICYPTLRYLRN
jgi:hypothetical protein